MAGLQNERTFCAGPADVRLGARLLAAAKAVRAGVPVADIGCDHGKLAVYLALHGAPRVIAVDSRAQPLEKTRELVRRHALQQVVDCRLGDGLAALRPGEAEDIVIAGLSGETIAELIRPWEWLRREEMRLVLVPASRHERLRHFLYGEGFALAAEQPVLENRRAYTVMQVVYTGEKTQPDACFCQLGRVPEMPGAASRTYVQARLAELQRQLRAPRAPEALKEHHLLIEQVQEIRDRL